MLHPSTKRLIDRLAEMTELGKLDWTEGDNQSLVYSTEGYSVCLPDGANEIVITSIEGKELERAASDALAASMNDTGTSYAQIVADMAGEAARVARGTEAAISSLLAGMDESVAAPENDETDLDESGPEDPGDEVAAMASEGIVSHEVPSQAEPEIEASDDPEPESAADAPEAMMSADEGDDVLHDTPEEIVAFAAETEQTSDDGNTVEAVIETVDTESDVTEAVARMADEVNNREEPEPDLSTTSAIGAAAATAVGAVVSAAGMHEPESTDDADAEDHIDDRADATEIVSDPIVEAQAAPAYVPFGLEEETDEAALAEAAPEAEIVSIADSVATADHAEASEFVVDVSEDISTEVESDVEVAPESEPTPEPEFETPADSFADAAPVAEAWLPTEPERDSAVIEPEPERADAPEVEPEVNPQPVEPVAAETDSEPVLTTPEQPQTYSLSGIGAGFGLGALSAKTEASGIPGPSSVSAPEPEKIVIDATDDVLPEIEGNLNLPPIDSSSEISFGNGDDANAASDSDESDGDILKPRTRFNPWD